MKNNEIYPFKVTIKTWGTNPMDILTMELFIDGEYVDSEAFTVRPIIDNEQPYIKSLTKLLKRNNVN